MAQLGRLVTVIFEVSDLDRSTTLFRDAFGLDLLPGDNEVDDRWIGGRHTEISWREGSYLHFALFREGETDLWCTDLAVRRRPRQCSRESATCGYFRRSRTTYGTLGKKRTLYGTWMAT